jgi:hypothetical protein
MSSQKTQSLPFNLTNYINTHFREEFLFEVKNILQVDGRTEYEVQVSKDDYIYTLWFDEEGRLLRQNAEQAYPDADESYRDIPD